MAILATERKSVSLVPLAACTASPLRTVATYRPKYQAFCPPWKIALFSAVQTCSGTWAGSPETLLSKQLRGVGHPDREVQCTEMPYLVPSDFTFESTERKTLVLSQAEARLY